MRVVKSFPSSILHQSIHELDAHCCCLPFPQKNAQISEKTLFFFLSHHQKPHFSIPKNLTLQPTSPPPPPKNLHHTPPSLPRESPPTHPPIQAHPPHDADPEAPPRSGTPNRHVPVAKPASTRCRIPQSSRRVSERGVSVRTRSSAAAGVLRWGGPRGWAQGGAGR